MILGNITEQFNTKCYWTLLLRPGFMQPLENLVFVEFPCFFFFFFLFCFFFCFVLFKTKNKRNSNTFVCEIEKSEVNPIIVPSKLKNKDDSH